MNDNGLMLCHITSSSQKNEMKGGAGSGEKIFKQGMQLDDSI